MWATRTGEHLEAQRTTTRYDAQPLRQALEAFGAAPTAPATAANNPQLAAAEAANENLTRIASVLTEKLDDVSARLASLVNVGVAASSEEVGATREVRQAVQQLTAETRNAAQAAAARRR